MSKARAAGVLGALILCGVLFLSHLAVAQKNSYFAILQGAFTRACIELAPGVLVQRTDEEADAFLDACLGVIRALKTLPPFNNTPDDIAQAIIGQVAPGGTCERCVQAIQDFETTLATNGTVQDLAESLRIGCARRFSDPVHVNQCRQIVDALDIPASVDSLLSDFPPLIACRALNLCPLE